MAKLPIAREVLTRAAPATKQFVAEEKGAIGDYSKNLR